MQTAHVHNPSHPCCSFSSCAAPLVITCQCCIKIATAAAAACHCTAPVDDVIPMHMHTHTKPPYKITTHTSHPQMSVPSHAVRQSHLVSSQPPPPHQPTMPHASQSHHRTRCSRTYHTNISLPACLHAAPHACPKQHSRSSSCPSDAL